jgi:hypothetical protein
LSVIWFVIGFPVLLWKYSVLHHQSSFDCQYRLALANMGLEQEIPNPDDRKKKIEANFAEYQKCKEAEASSTGIPILLGLLGLDLATVIAGWAIVWCVVFVVRWIIQGFATG